VVLPVEAPVEAPVEPDEDEPVEPDEPVEDEPVPVLPVEVSPVLVPVLVLVLVPVEVSPVLVPVLVLVSPIDVVASVVPVPELPVAVRLSLMLPEGWKSRLEGRSRRRALQ